MCCVDAGSLSVSSKRLVVISKRRTHDTAGWSRLSRNIPPPPINSLQQQAAENVLSYFFYITELSRCRSLVPPPLLSPAHLSRCLRGSSLCLSCDVTR